MLVFLIIVDLIVLILITLITAMRPSPGQLSRFELDRRYQKGDSSAKQLLFRERALVDILSLQKVLINLLIIVFALLSVATFGWLAGILLSLLLSLEYGQLARLGFVRSLANSLYKKLEPKLIKFVRAAPAFFKIICSVVDDDLDLDLVIGSKPELQRLIEKTVGVLSDDEKKLLNSGLDFDQTLVSSIMTPRSVIDTVPAGQMLGPVTLDDFYQTGHSRLPVIDGDIDHVVGILNIKSLLALDIKRTTTVDKAMEPKVYYIHQDQTLGHALAAFIKTHHHLFIVVNEYRETVGLITLEDVIESLIGRKIVDEFDCHDDLRSVALRNPRANNQPKNRQDV